MELTNSGHFPMHKSCILIVSIASFFILSSCDERKITTKPDTSHHDDFNNYIVKYSNNIKFEVVYATEIDPANNPIVFFKKQDALICSSGGSQVIFFDAIEDSEIERRLSYWDSVLDAKSNKDNRKIRYGELFLLTPEASNIIKIISNHYDAYLIIDSDNTLKGLIWYDNGEKSSKIQAKNIDKDMVLSFFAQLSIQESDLIRQLNVSEQ